MTRDDRTSAPWSRLLSAVVALALLPWPAPGVGPLEFRSIDGSGNCLQDPQRGSAGSELLRMVAPAYGDGVSALAGAGRPDPRSVSNEVFAQASSLPSGARISSVVFQWGQFLDHDLDLTAAADPPEPADIPVPPGDRFFDPARTGRQVIRFDRSRYAMSGTPAVRQQMNEVTAFIDASQVYGSDALRAAALRTANGGLLTSRRRLLPFNTAGLPNAPRADDPSLFLAGDVRANEQPGLTAMHTLFVREHNRLLRMRRLRRWLPPEATAETRYQLARAIVGAEMQAITYREFLPAVLGPDALAPYRGYDPSVNAGIDSLFSTAAYRVGHTLVPAELLRLDRRGRPIGAGSLPLRDAFFAPEHVRRHGIEPILRGLAAHRPEEVDTFVVDELRNFLFGPPAAGGLDLVALNIQRGRDHGLASYNEVRAALGLPRAACFAEITARPDVQQSLARAYGSPDALDAWVGGLAEDHRPGALVGELYFRILKDQFERLRDGDRFWYEIALPPEIVRYVERQTLSRIIRQNTRIGTELRRDVFRLE